MNIQRLNNFLRISSHHTYRYNGYCQQLTDFPATFQIKHNWYELWKKNNYFSPTNTDKEHFKIILPPPNITGTLHLGHALTVTIQDILARWHIMKGHPVTWIPGIDHAGIATQVVVEKYLSNTKGISRYNIGRNEFASHMWNWKSEKADIILKQLKNLGASLDWSKIYFTMDKSHNAAVTEAFVTLYKRNMLYRDKRIINWSPSLQSTISDIEVEFQKIDEKTDILVPGYDKKVSFGQIVELAFQLKDSKDEILVATTRPETLFGDVAIAVHPNDERYSRYVGQQIWHPLREAFIPIISDSSVNREFGTGAVKITPAHDKLDYEISKNHHLDIIDVFDIYGNMTAAAKEFEGLPRFVARNKILKLLSERNILRHVKDHKVMLPICTRTGDIVEFVLKEQWFIKCKDMARRALEVVKDGSLKIDPVIHEQLWYTWLENVRDWCISRQLWWGHCIPAYYTTVEGNTEWIVSKSEQEAMLTAKEKYGPNIQIYQDQDVLDTWFSSALLPMTTMGWPSKIEEFKVNYPLTLMETGHDIFFFWVARMVMLGLELTNDLPFKKVLLHGVLCDGKGKKMSKSLGNIISPENVINGVTSQELDKQAKENNNAGLLSDAELKNILTLNKKSFPNGIPECGVDALRFTLCSHNIKERTINFNIDECRTNKFFCNKIWQASKYTLIMANNVELCQTEKPKTLTNIDHWILSRLTLMVNSVNEALGEHNFSVANASIKQFLYYEFCDFYLEGTKWAFRNDEKDIASGHIYTLAKCLEVSLRILAPITPYLSDELYLRLSNRLPGFLSLQSLLEASYPLPQEFCNMRNESLEKKMTNVISMISAIRNVMAYTNKKMHPEVHVVVHNIDDYAFYNECKTLIARVCKINNILICQSDNYTVRESSIKSTCEDYGVNCTLFVLVKDDASLEHIKNNMQKKKLKMEKKQRTLMNKTNLSKQSVKT